MEHRGDRRTGGDDLPLPQEAWAEPESHEEEKERIGFGKANIDAEPSLAEKYEVMAAPTLIFFHQGKEAARFRGIVKEEEIRVAIEKLKNL